MKTKLMIGILIGVASLLLLSFTTKETKGLSRTEEYGMLVYRAGMVEKTVNGKTEIYTIDSEKIPDMVGKNFSTALLKELTKMNEAGFEIVNVSFAVAQNGERSLYLFKRKI